MGRRAAGDERRERHLFPGEIAQIYIAIYTETNEEQEIESGLSRCVSTCEVAGVT